MIEFDLSEVKDLAQRMGKVKASKAWKRVVPGKMRNLMGRAQVYPPARPRPGRGSWYDRGFGTRYIKVDGSAGASQRTSENLLDKWKVTNKALYSEIKNTASYAKYVVGEMQTALHEKTGWKKLSDVANARIPMIVRDLTNELLKALRGL